MTDKEVADMLYDYIRAKDVVRDKRLNIIHFVVETLGYDQKLANAADVGLLIDGYLIGRGAKDAGIAKDKS